MKDLFNRLNMNSVYSVLHTHYPLIDNKCQNLYIFKIDKLSTLQRKLPKESFSFQNSLLKNSKSKNIHSLITPDMKYQVNKSVYLTIRVNNDFAFMRFMKANQNHLNRRELEK